MNPNDPNIPLLEKIIGALGELADRVVVVGGSAAGLLITDEAEPPIRSTLDVDAIVATTSRIEYYDFEHRLRASGFKQDMREGAPLCRWLFEETQFDLMVSEPGVLGDSNPWYPEAVATAREVALPSGLKFKLIQGAAFLATKLAAFADRGKGDYYGSQDMEDIFAIIDGREEVLEELGNASQELRAHVLERLRHHANRNEFWDALSGFFRTEGIEVERAPVFRARLERLFELPD